MKAREVCHAIFNLVVRLLGLVFLYHGLSSIPTVLQLFMTKSFANYVLGLILLVWPLVVAWWLIGGAPQLMDRAYPDPGEETKAGVPFTPKSEP